MFIQAIETPRYYRTNDGGVTLLVSNVEEDSKMFKKRARFQDHRGWYYDENGENLSKKRPSAVEELTLDFVTDEEQAEVATAIMKRIKRARMWMKASEIATFATILTSGVNLGFGYLFFRASMIRMSILSTTGGVVGATYGWTEMQKMADRKKAFA